MYGMQRYKCKDCNYNYTKGRNSKDRSIKRFALELYLEGLGFRSIGRILKVSHVSIFNWIKQYGQNLDLLQNSHEICVTEIDEMHSYIGSKKTLSGSGLLLIEYAKEFINFVVGDRSTRTGKELWEGVKDRAKGIIATDYWKPYEKFVPKDKHIQSKAHTYTIEGYNSLFRHFLARMRRKEQMLL
jgi:IS1 family transposase